jgi:hypothetical protein
MPIFYLLKGEALIEREVPPPEATLVPGVCLGTSGRSLHASLLDDSVLDERRRF